MSGNLAVGFESSVRVCRSVENWKGWDAYTVFRMFDLELQSTNMRAIFFTIWSVSLVYVAMPIQAQTQYTCSSNGRTYQSTQPCQGSSSRGLMYFGPITKQPTYEQRIPSVGQAPDTLKYMTPRCASLNDAIRTAPTRGLEYDIIGKMQREYSNECSESESEARAQLSRDRADQQRAAKETSVNVKLEKERSAIQEQQCGESKRILYNKRARTDLTEGEKNDLNRFEKNFRSRCG